VELLRVENLTVAYGPRIVLDGVSLSLQAGEVFLLLGPNGAGKTTLLAAIAGLRRPVGARILVAGTDLALNPLAARTSLGVLLQPPVFFPGLTSGQCLRLFAELQGLPMTRHEARIHLQAVGLQGRADEQPDDWSLGERQRLALAVALAHRPRVVLLDEPTAGLDPAARRAIWDRVRTLRDAGSAVLWASHDMAETLAVADRAGLLRHGRLEAEGAPEAVVRVFAADDASTAPGGFPEGRQPR
jgi:ABC-2 type transport system ATP-binding protein